MPFRPANLVHTDEAALAESTPSGMENGSPEPLERPLSSAVERRVHIADVVGSIPTVATTKPSARYRKARGLDKEPKRRARQPLTPERKEHLRRVRAMFDENVYFIQDVASGQIKIGYATDPQGRLYRLQVGNPNELRMLAYLPHPEAADLEVHLHSRFSQHRGRGEWFQPAPELLRLIRVIRRECTKDDLIGSVVFIRARRGRESRVDWSLKAHGWSIKEWQNMDEVLASANKLDLNPCKRSSHNLGEYA